jgi:hypothetical protein
LNAVSFAPEHRSGVLAPETVAAALQRHRDAEAETLEPSPLAEEIDADPEYQEWIREVPNRARELATAGPQPEVKRFPSLSAKPAYALAAMFALAAVGLAFWALRLRSEVDRLSLPVFNPPAEVVELGQGVRGGNTLQVRRDASHVLLVLALDPSLGPEPRDGYLEVLRRSGEPVWRSPRIRLLPLSEMSLFLPRRLLPDGDYRVLVYPESGFSAQPLTVEPLRVETKE